jgi:hypothetical protein
MRVDADKYSHSRPTEEQSSGRDINVYSILNITWPANKTFLLSFICEITEATP